MPLLKQADLTEVSQSLEALSPTELLLWAKETFGDRVAALSAMQKAGSVVCHMIAALQLNVRVLFVDTGVNFQETLQTRDRIAREYGLEVVTLHPKLSMEEQTRKHGVLYLSVEGQEQCCAMRKIEPLLSVKGHYDCLIGSLRRSEGGRRGNSPLLHIDPKMNCVRINPLANFTDEQMQTYLKEQPVVINPLHDQGYATIGCNRCTTPVLDSEPKRAGRWRHLGPWSQYCKVNPTDVEGGTAGSIDLPQKLIDRILGRETDFTI